MESVDCPNCGSSRHETVLVAEDILTHLGGTFRIATTANWPSRIRGLRLKASISSIRPIIHPILKKNRNARSRPLETPPRIGPLASLLRLPAAARGAAHRTHLDGGPRCHSPHTFAGALDSVRAPGRLLDFGCGAGEFVKQMREYGWNAEGLDFSPRMVEILRQKGDFRASGDIAASRYSGCFARRGHDVALARARPLPTAGIASGRECAETPGCLGDHCAQF